MTPRDARKRPVERKGTMENQNQTRMTLEQATSRELELEQVKRRIAEADAELLRITTQVLPGMMEKQNRRRKELERQQTLARCSNVGDERLPADNPKI